MEPEETQMDLQGPKKDPQRSKRTQRHSMGPVKIPQYPNERGLWRKNYYKKLFEIYIQVLPQAIYLLACFDNAHQHTSTVSDTRVL